MSRRRVWVLRVLSVSLLALACQQLWRHGHDYVWPEKFLQVEPGIYRGAWQYDWPMRRIIRDYKIKTIVALAHPPDSPKVLQEQALARELGCRWIHVPIVEDGPIGQRKTVAGSLEQAAAVIADPANHPVYFHCHHGVNRASLVQVAYRTIHCGWTLERAIAEIEQTIGLDPVEHGVDYRYLPEFYRERVLPRRQAQAAAGGESRR